MPALAFGLKSNKQHPVSAKPAPKRKAFFEEAVDSRDNDGEGEDDDDDAFAGLQKPKSISSKPKFSLSGSSQPPLKSPKLNGKSLDSKNGPSKYANLSALRSAKLQDQEASMIDESVYDYDAVYDSFHVPKDKNKSQDESSGPKYMTSLLESAETRKRDQIRAREKLLQKEREAEGDEFADKEKFVTGAYKKQMEENRKLEEEEKERAEAEEERRRKGGGMTEFNKNLLRKEEERQRDIQQATEEAQRRKEAGENVTSGDNETEVDENRAAAELNKQGAGIVVNDEGEVVDKRQLLGAGLNIAPKKPGVNVSQKKSSTQSARPHEWRRSERAQDARMSQRERQTRMVERQIEELEEKQRQAEEAESKELEEKNKSKLTEESKMSAKERYLQRKREREEQANKKSGG